MEAAMTQPKPLAHQVAVVAGATRGAGRGIARGLGEAGATVYCTGRSTTGNPSPYRRSETIEETAAMVTDLGGHGIAVRVDHTVEAEVEALFARIDVESKRLDVLVNSVAGEDPTLEWNKPFWKTDLTETERALRQAFLSHVLTAKHAVPRMIRKRRGLIVEVTDRESFGYGRMGFNHDLIKASVMRLGHVMAEELRRHHVTAVSLSPGYLRSEVMLDHFGVPEERWEDAGKKDPLFLGSESPIYLGRAIAALAADPKKMELSGEAMGSGELARRYGVTDYDGRQPDIIAYFSEHLPHNFFGEGELERGVAWLERVTERSRRLLPAQVR
jgi:NAD(P)-dependent dehydrogenase (short-subunit alcohol dehydrogenase family)